MFSLQIFFAKILNLNFIVLGFSWIYKCDIKFLQQQFVKLP